MIKKKKDVKKSKYTIEYAYNNISNGMQFNPKKVIDIKVYMKYL